MEKLLYIAGAVAIIGAAVAIIWKTVRGVARLVKRVRDFLDDFYGEPDRPGVPGRPGVMVQLAQIHAELRPNGGGSMRDAVNRIELSFEEHIKDNTAHRPKQE